MSNKKKSYFTFPFICVFTSSNIEATRLITSSLHSSETEALNEIVKGFSSCSSNLESNEMVM